MRAACSAPRSPHTYPLHSYPGLEPGRASLLARVARHDCKKRVCVSVLVFVALAAALVTNMCVPWPRLLHVLVYWVLSAVLLLTGTPRPEPCLLRPWTQRAPKACPGSFSVVDGDWAAVVPCSGHGTCAGRPGRPVCREGDTCDVACVCDAGYGGAGCGSTTNQTAAARQVRSLTKAQPPRCGAC